MPEPQNLRATGERIEQALSELEGRADAQLLNLAEELLRLVSDLYSAGLSRVVEIAHDTSPTLMGALLGDELVASLLLVHGLHPDSIDLRVGRALDSVRPFLAQHGGGVELLGIDDELGAVKLRLLGSCDGCPSSALTLKGAVETAILEAAPEVTRIVVEEPTPAASTIPVTLSRKPAYDECPAEVAHG
jgi:Fe-S cluster biogenesis protein NfuA